MLQVKNECFVAILVFLLKTNKSNSPLYSSYISLDVKRQMEGKVMGTVWASQKAGTQISFIFLPHLTNFHKATRGRFYFSKQSKTKSELDELIQSLQFPGAFLSAKIHDFIFFFLYNLFFLFILFYFFTFWHSSKSDFLLGIKSAINRFDTVICRQTLVIS